MPIFGTYRCFVNRFFQMSDFMKIIYFSTTCISDAEFPLIKEYYKQGIDVQYYVQLLNVNLKSGLFDIKKQIKRTGIFKASDFKDMEPYASYIDLDKINIVNFVDHRMRYLPTVLLWIRLFLKFLFMRPNVIHFGWPLEGIGKILYFLPAKKVLTIHDPFRHSSNTNIREEKDRVFAFKKVDKICLLSSIQLSSFCKYYKIPKEKIFLNKLGDYGALRECKSTDINISSPYILFFGLISSYKGLEYLCKAMTKIHVAHPDVKLIIAGGGKIYFNFENYANLDYIILINRYITVPELSGLLKSCLFTVCPYKDATQSGVVQTAFTMGVPAIVTNVGALPIAVEDGITGLVIPPCNSDAIEDACNKLIMNPQLIAEMKHNIASIWQKNMNWDVITEKYMEVYENISN